MSDRHEHLDEGRIHAWLDGALSPDESARIESRASTCEECGARVAEARGLVAASSRILASLDAVPGGVIPGTTRGSDQLAALRARRQASARRWWQDRRVVIAASLILVAGVSRLAWQSRSEPAVDTRSDQLSATARPAAPVVTADAPAAVPAPVTPSREAREMKVAVPTERRAAPQRVALSADSIASLKAADASPPPARTTPAVANELRRLESVVVGATGAASPRRDSTALSEVRSARVESQTRQQTLGGAARQAPQQLRADSSRIAASPPASFGERQRLSPVVPTGVAAARADAIVVTCYLLRLPSGVDTVRLVNQQVPVLGDPAWFRAVASGALRDSTLSWRSIDSLTVELRRGNGVDSTVLRFMVSGAVPDVQGQSGVRSLPSSRIKCP